MVVAVILDPRYKLEVVEFYFPSIYGDDAAYKIKRIKQTYYDLLHEYQYKISTTNSSSCTPTTSTLSAITKDIASCEEEEGGIARLVQFLSSTSSTMHVKSALNYYLEEPILPWTQNFDMLNWWKTNGIKYPTLQLIARDFLAIPVSTIASKSIFDTGGKVVSLHKRRFHPKTLEALICSQNWLWNEMEGKYLRKQLSIYLQNLTYLFQFFLIYFYSSIYFMCRPLFLG